MLYELILYIAVYNLFNPENANAIPSQSPSLPQTWDPASRRQLPLPPGHPIPSHDLIKPPYTTPFSTSYKVSHPPPSSSFPHVARQPPSFSCHPKLETQ